MPAGQMSNWRGPATETVFVNSRHFSGVWLAEIEPNSLVKNAREKVALIAVRRLSERWCLTEEQQASLLNASPLQLREWQNAAEPELSADTLVRISHLLNIYDGLHVVFGDATYADEWITRQNKHFGDRTPLCRMLEGIDGLAEVHDYFARARA